MQIRGKNWLIRGQKYFCVNFASVRKSKKNADFLLYFTHLFVPLTRYVQGTHVRKYKENNKFPLYFAHLIVPLHTNLDHVYDGLQDFWKVYAP